MKSVLMLAAAITAALCSSSCSSGQKVAAANATVRVEPAADPNVFTVDKPEEFEMVEASIQRVHDDLPANGVVAPDVSRTVPVTSLSSGRVIEIGARLGDDVKKGQLLLKIDSADLAAAYADYHKALADETLARKGLDRATALFEHGAAAQKDVEGADSGEQKALVDVRNTAEKIRILGGVVDHPTPVLEVRAPASGTIVEQNIQAAGGVKSLDNSPNLFTIADLSSVWILCDIYENNLSQVRLGDLAEVRLNAYPERVFKARVSNIARVLDPATRTAKVRLELPNTGAIMRPGMFAMVRFSSQTVTDRIVVPATAVLRLHDKDWVFRPLGGNRFRRDQIVGGGANPDGSQLVLSGMAAGERVVRNALRFSATVEK